MKGLAFAYDPDKYWVEIVKRGATPGKIPNKFNFSQTMLRVKDPKKSIEFYKKLGMSVMCERHFSDFSLYFLASNVDNAPEDPSSDDAKENVRDLFQPVRIYNITTHDYTLTCHAKLSTVSIYVYMCHNH